MFCCRWTIPKPTTCRTMRRVSASFRWEDVYEEFDWAKTGKVNMAHEAIDRHLTRGRRNKLALIYTDKERTERFTFEDMSLQSNRFANVLRKLGVGKGDRVFVFLGRRPELYIAILGILKIGAIPSPLFEAFMEDAVRDRMANAEAVALVTSPALVERVPQYDLPSLKHIILVGASASELGEGQKSYEALMEKAEDKTEIEWLTLDDPLIMHYTSGSTGKPKGVLHVQKAMLGHLMTGRWVLDMREDDVYWCTADPGWVTGTSYGIFSPWLNGATNLIRGGRFNAADWYETIQRFRVNIWYSAPTAFRMLMAAGDDVAQRFDLSSLRHVLSVGEPLNPEVVWWGWRTYGRRIHDNWWMTETGHILISNYPAMTIRPGSMGRPIPGVYATIVDDDGKEVPPNTLGNLVVKPGWPGMMKTIWKQPERYETYFRIPGWYVTGDSAYKDPGWLLLVPGARGRPDHHGRRERGAVRSRKLPGGTPGRGGSRGDWKARRHARTHHQGFHFTARRLCAQRRTEGGNPEIRAPKAGRARGAARD